MNPTTSRGARTFGSSGGCTRAGAVFSTFQAPLDRRTARALGLVRVQQYFWNRDAEGTTDPLEIA